MQIDSRFLSAAPTTLATWQAAYTVHPAPFTRHQWDRVPTHDAKETAKQVGWGWGRSTKLENCQFETSPIKIQERRYESDNFNHYPAGDPAAV